MQYKFQTIWYKGIIGIGILIFLCIAMLIWEIIELVYYYVYSLPFYDIEFMSWLTFQSVWFLIGCLELTCVFIYYELLTTFPIVILLISYCVSLASAGYAIYLYRTFAFSAEVIGLLLAWLNAEITVNKMLPLHLTYFQQMHNCCSIFNAGSNNLFGNLPKERQIHAYPISCCRELLPCHRISEGLDPYVTADVGKIFFTDDCQTSIREYYNHYLLIFEAHTFFCICIVFLALFIYLVYIQIDGEDKEGQPRRRRFNFLHRKRKNQQQAIELPQVQQQQVQESLIPIRPIASGENMLSRRNESLQFVTESYKGYKWKSLVQNTYQRIHEANDVLHRRRNQQGQNNDSSREAYDEPEERVYLFRIGNTKY